MKKKSEGLKETQRDFFKCTECGSGDNLHAHHIEKVSDNIHKITDTDNGITLCRGCHKIKHGRGV